MDEEKENKEQPTANDSGEGIQPETNKLLDDTNLAAKRMEEATKAAKEERMANEESYAKMKLGGGSEAGQQAKAPKEETSKEYAEKVMKGEIKSE